MEVPYYRHSLGKNELSSLACVFDGLFLTDGPKVREFEKRFSEFLDVPFVVAFNSCTTSLQLTLRALSVHQKNELNPGSEWKLITTPLSFVATANAALYNGIDPVFVDVNPATGLIDLEKLHATIACLKGLSVVILPVHLYGQMVDMKEIERTAVHAGLRNYVVVEDSAHCIDGWREDYRPGHLSQAACFSFHALKTMTCGDGGAVAVKDEYLASKLRVLRSHGMSKGTVERSLDYSIPQMVELGFKANLTDIQAAILLPQIEFLESRRQIRKAIAERYMSAFRKEPEIRLLRCEDGVTSSFSQFIILVRPEIRRNVLQLIRSKGVGVIVSFPVIHLMPYYRERFGYAEGDFPNAEHIGFSNIALPIYPSLNDDEQNYVIDMIVKAVRQFS